MRATNGQTMTTPTPTPTPSCEADAKATLEARKSAASSGIGHDSSESSSNYSPCVSTSSLDAGEDEDGEDDDDDDDDVEFHSSATSPDAVFAGREIRRAASLQVKSSTRGKSEHRSASLDDSNVTVVEVNPGGQDKIFTTRSRSVDNRRMTPFSSLLNITPNPGYMKIVDEEAAWKLGFEYEDENKNVTRTSSTNGVATPAYVKLTDAETPKAIESGVKFVDGGVGGDGDSICSSDNSSEDDDQRKSKAPDGGWGWVIVAASFFISMIADGISFSFGLLYIEFLDYFGESSSRTSLIGSLFMSVPLLTGPISSGLVDRYGCRTMTIIGGVVAGLGFVASAFQESVEMMYLTFGLIAGLGLGLCYVTAVVSIAYWFDKRRTLATGLGACGTGFGTVVYARMTSYFISEYGWRGTVLLLAGTFFNMCVGGALMRDPEWWGAEQRAASLAGTKSLRAASSCGSVSGFADGSTGKEGDFPGVDELRRMLQSGESPGCPLAAPGRNNSYRSVVNLPTFVRRSEKVPLEVLESLSANQRVFHAILDNYPSLLLCRSASDGSRLNAVDARPARVPVNVRPALAMTMRADTTESSVSPASPEPLLGSTPAPPVANGTYGAVVGKPALPALKKQLFMPATHHLRHIRVHRNSVMYRGAMLNIHRYRLRASSCPDIYRNSMTTIAKENQEKWYADMVDLVRGMLDFSMFLELHFLLMSIATILLFIWFIVPYFYLADHVRNNGYTEDQVSSLLMIIGCTNFIGMVVLGWAGDQPWMNVTKTYAGCLVVCGVATLTMPYVVGTYWLLACVCALFGLFFASSFSFTPVILVQLIPLERFTTAYGLSLMCQGIGNLVGPPLAGWVYDRTRTYDLSFVLAGAWIVVAGLLIAAIPATRNRRVWGNGPVERDKDTEHRESSMA